MTEFGSGKSECGIGKGEVGIGTRRRPIKRDYGAASMWNWELKGAQSSKLKAQ